MAILVKDGKVLMSDGKILTSQAGSNSNVNLTKRVPIPNILTIKEFSFDTSKTTEEVDAILSQLTYEDDTDTYRVCEKYSNGWYGIFVRTGFIADFAIMYSDDDTDIILYDSENGWNLDVVIDGKFTPLNPMIVGGFYNPYNGLENDKLIDVIWYDQPIYVPIRKEVKLEDLDYEYSQYEEIDWKIHDFNFYNRCLDDKIIIINLADYGMGSDDILQMWLDGAKNCRILIMIGWDVQFRGFFAYELGDYKVIFDEIAKKSLAEDYPIYFEGTRYPETCENVFTMYSDSGTFPYYLVIDFDNDGNSTFTLTNFFEY